MLHDPALHKSTTDVDIDEVRAWCRANDGRELFKTETVQTQVGKNNAERTVEKQQVPVRDKNA